jgi:hypothetical protein
VEEIVADQACPAYPAGYRGTGLFYQRVGERVFHGSNPASGLDFTLEFGGNILIRTASDGSKAYFRRQ